MTDIFVVCTACNRHVRATSPACPFCDAPREPSPERSRGALGRLSRAAVLSLGAAALADCETPVAPPYGVPPMRYDVPPTVDAPAVEDTGPRTCTLIGCSPSLVVGFERASGWTAGRYRIEVVVDGTQQACEVVLPLVCGVAPTCTGDYAWGPTTSGCALDPSQQALTGLAFRYPAAPSRVSVGVFQTGRRIGGGDIAPVYVESHPNGPGCEPLCRTAPAQTLALDP